MVGRGQVLGDLLDNLPFVLIPSGLIGGLKSQAKTGSHMLKTSESGSLHEFNEQTEQEKNFYRVKPPRFQDLSATADGCNVGS